MFVVAGVSGRTGAAVADRLLAAGRPVRVLVRAEEKGGPWRARGAEVAVASLEDQAAVARALEGAAGAYLLLPEDLRSDDPISDGWRMAHAIAGAVERTRLPHLAFLSSMGAHQAEGTGLVRRLHAAEERLSQTPAGVTFVRAAYLLDNWAAVMGAAAHGPLPTFIPPDRVLPMVATRDVGAVAAAALLEGPPADRRAVVQLAGPRDLSPRDVAAALGRVLGRAVEPVPAPLEAVGPAFATFGASPAFAEQVRLMIQAIAEGRLGWDEEGEARLVRGPTDADTFFTALSRR